MDYKAKAIKIQVERELQENFRECQRLCIRRPDIYQQRIAAVMFVMRYTRLNLIDAKRWVEENMTFPVTPV